MIWRKSRGGVADVQALWGDGLSISCWAPLPGFLIDTSSLTASKLISLSDPTIPMEDFSVPLNTISFHHPQNLLDQRSENFFHEGKDSEYFQI